MSSISVRVDAELKKLMAKLPHVNWSEIIRQAILKTIQDEKESNMARAVLLNEKVRKKAPAGFNSTDLIRKSRRERFGSQE